MKRKIEIITKPNWKENKLKLTIAVDRISIKISQKTDEKMQQRQKKFCIFVSKKIYIQNTLRGKISPTKDSKFKICLYTRNRKKVYIFKEMEESFIVKGV